MRAYVTMHHIYVRLTRYDPRARTFNESWARAPNVETDAYTRGSNMGGGCVGVVVNVLVRVGV